MERTWGIHIQYIFRISRLRSYLEVPNHLIVNQFNIISRDGLELHLGGFLKWGYPKIDGLFHGKSHENG